MKKKCGNYRDSGETYFWSGRLCSILDKIVFGATVELFDVAEDKDVTYKIVGELEADIKQNLISVTSPIARALIGKSVDDEVVVNAPGGDREYEITAVYYK